MTKIPSPTTLEQRLRLNRYALQMLDMGVDPTLIDEAQELARSCQGAYDLFAMWATVSTSDVGNIDQHRNEIECDLRDLVRDNSKWEKKEPTNILVDCDQVLSNFVDSCLDLAARQFNVFAKPEDVTGEDIGASIGCPALEHLITEETLNREFCYRMKPIPEGLNFFKALEETYGKDRVFVATKLWRGDSRETASGEWASQRLAWLRDHLGVSKSRVFLCDSKHMVTGILVDDSVKNLEKRRPGAGFCIQHPYNSRWTGPRGDYQQCLEWLKGKA